MEQEIRHLAPGTKLAGGKYRIVRFIGAGGFGCTYEAEFVPMATRVAIKEFFVNLYCSRTATGEVSVCVDSQRRMVEMLEEKFRREAQHLFKLQHRNIVRVSDILQENNTSYYVMDYIAGYSLQAIVDRSGPLTEAAAVKYIMHVMDALEYVHDKNMLHLDIKPDNIMVESDTDQAILIDFGVSKQYDEVDGHNNSSLVGMTPGFAPPEQVGNNMQQFTPAADIYSLGATLYALLTGKTPPSCVDLISGTVKMPPLPSSTSKTVRNAISTMMEHAVAKRPQTVGEARQMLGGAAPVKEEHPKEKKGLLRKLFGRSSDDGKKDKGTVLRPSNKPAVTPPVEPALDVVTPVEPDLVIEPVDESMFEFIESPEIEPVDELYAEPVAFDGIEGDHEWVDMGLSVKWATCNIGAFSPSNPGDYFAWGEVQPAPNGDYSQVNCRLSDKKQNSIAANPQYDAAAANWGGRWRMPTRQEWYELIVKCKWEWDNGCVRVTARNGNTLILPVAGWKYGNSTTGQGRHGAYWSATSNGSKKAWSLYAVNGGNTTLGNDRVFGLTVRPVVD